MTSIQLPYPHPGQRIVRQQARRFNWLAAGRRWRKTTLVMSIAVEEALQGKTIVWGAPTYDQVRVGWEETRHACANLVDFNETRMQARFPRRGQILYRSLDNPDNARGHTADGVVIDEIQDVSPAAWYEVLRPMLLDTGGWMWGVGTPKGQNWVFREHTRAVDRADSRAWQAPTLGVRETDTGLERAPHPLENPYISLDEIQQLYESIPQATFEQEVLGLFLEQQGAVFRNLPAVLTAPVSSPAAHAGHRIVLGGDWAQRHDFTALSVGCADCRQELALDRFNQIGWALQRDRLLTLAARWGVQEAVLEANSIGGPNIEALQDVAPFSITAFQTTASSKPPLIQALALACDRASARWLPDPVAAAELAAYEATVSPTTGTTRYSAPEGMHDDTVIARALAWWGMQHSSQGVF